MEAWENFLSQQEADFGRDTVDKWLRSLKILRFDACNLYLEAKDSFQALWIEEQIRPKLIAAFVNNNKKPIKVHLSIANVSQKKAKGKEKKAIAKEAIAPPKFTLAFDTTDPHYLFENYVVTPSNELAVKLLSNFSQEPHERSLPQESLNFNPIYIYGAKGTGKTHLLMATANALRKKGLKVIYARAETFTEHVVAAIRSGEMGTFRNAYRNSDVLLIDDVQIFGRKAATQEEFFHTFNSLHLADKQIILSANSAPPGLQSIEPRLVSRFEWGIALPLELQSRDEMALIMHRKAEALNYRLSPKMATFLLETFQTGTKSILRALQALILRSHLNEGESAFPTFISIPQAKAILQDLIAEEQQATLTPEKILLHVAEQFGIRPEDILKKGQSRCSVLPRQLAMYFCRMELKMPFAKIGIFFSKDHSTVMSSVKLITTAIDNNTSEIVGPLHAIKKKMHP